MPVTVCGFESHSAHKQIQLFDLLHFKSTCLEKSKIKSNKNATNLFVFQLLFHSIIPALFALRLKLF